MNYGEFITSITVTNALAEVMEISMKYKAVIESIEESCEKPKTHSVIFIGITIDFVTDLQDFTDALKEKHKKGLLILEMIKEYQIPDEDIEYDSEFD